MARTVGSITGLERWCPHMRRQLQQQYHRCRLHIHALLSPLSPWILPPPRIRSSGCIAQVKLLLGLQAPPPQQNIKSLCIVSSILLPVTAATIHISQLAPDAPLWEVASWRRKCRMSLAWGILHIDHRQDGRLCKAVSSWNAPATLIANTVKSSTHIRCGLLCQTKPVEPPPTPRRTV